MGAGCLMLIWPINAKHVHFTGTACHAGEIGVIWMAKNKNETSRKLRDAIYDLIVTGSKAENNRVA